MVCRCSSPAEHAQRAAEQSSRSHLAKADRHEKEITKLKGELERARRTPDNTRYEVREAKLVTTGGESDRGYIVLRVQFFGCNCEFSGVKIMVFADTSLEEAIKWKMVDPHFRPANKIDEPTRAPPPAARFPATDEGWADAIAYAQRKVS